MSITITIQTRNIFGNEVHYPMCTNAITFAKIAGTKTLTVQTLKMIRLLGYKIVQKPVARSF